MKNLKASERDKWMEGREGQACLTGAAEGHYLHNRIEAAWCSGWDAALANNHLIVGALDTLGVALSEHGHQWADGERAIYEQAVAIAKQEPIPQE